jgi:hypothetical protein
MTRGLVNPWGIVQDYCPEDVQEWVRTNVTFQPMFPGDLWDGQERNGVANPPELRTDGRWGIHYHTRPIGYTAEYMVLHEVAHAVLGHKRADADEAETEREADTLATAWLVGHAAGGTADDDDLNMEPSATGSGG